MLKKINGSYKSAFTSIVSIILLFITFISRSQTVQLRPVDYVNPLIGTAPMLDKDHIGNNPAPNEDLYYGSVNPAAKTPDPNGTLQLGPVSGFDGCCYHVRGSGYRYDDSSIMGFTHFNGQYSRDNNLLFMPTVGVIKTEAGPRENPFLGYRSLKDTLQEKASVGYYTVFLTTYGIKVELTATKNCGFHRYTFPASKQSNVLIDLANARPAATEASVKIIDGHTIEGYQLSGRNKIYFRAVFNKDFVLSGTWKAGIISPASTSDSGVPLGAYVTFNTTAGQQILVKVGTSKVSLQDAATNLENEIPGMDFNAVHQDAVSQWDRVLSYITVEGGTEDDRKNFYSCMYRLTEGPSYAGGWQGGAFCTPWTVRTLMRGRDWFSKRIDNRDSNNLGSRWLWSGEFWGIGSAWAPLGMYFRGFPQFNKTNLAAIYAKLREEAMIGGGAVGEAYRKYGYVPFGVINNCINHCLGLAYSDHVLAEYAKLLGKMDDYKLFSARSKNYKNVYNESVGFFMPRNADGTWFLVDPYDVHAESIFREGNAWNYLFYMMGDAPGLIDLLGGPEKFSSRLDTLFNKPLPANAYPLRDVTGFYNLYCHGNEVYRHTPYLYNYAGKPWKTQEIVRRIQKELQRPTPGGMCGMEDYGQLSGWYVSSAIGFYHVDNLTGDCDISSPLFPKVTINTDGSAPGKFEIIAHNVSDKNIYIQSATLNGKPLMVPRFHDKEIKAGGSLVFEMGPEPNYKWGTERPADK